MREGVWSNWLKWNPKKDAIIAIVLGFIIIFLSITMHFVRESQIISIVVRDLFMILLFGIGIPLFLIHKENRYKEFGLHVNEWYLFLPINFILGFLLLLVFLKQSPLPNNIVIDTHMIWKIAYIMLTGVFEIIIFYAYIRTTVEKSFGIIPGILLAAVFYSFHHAGFQPEFVKLIFVGILYATVFRLGNSALLIFPFFWGVGACYDVLIQSKEVSEIMYPQARSIILLIGIIVVFVYLYVKRPRGTSGKVEEDRIKS